MFQKRIIGGLTIVGLLTGCFGGRGTAPVPTNPVEGGVASPARKVAFARFIFVIPQAQSELKLKYISASTKSVSVDVNDSLSPKVLNIGQTQTTYSVDVKALEGENTFTVKLFDDFDLAGNLLAQGKVTATLTNGQTNTVNISPAGVVHSIQLGLDKTDPCLGGKSTLTLSIQAKDPGGNLIIGNYDQTIQITNSDISGAVRLGTATTTSSDAKVAVDYDGSDTGTVTLGAAADGVTTDNVTNTSLTPLTCASP